MLCPQGCSIHSLPPTPEPRLFPSQSQLLLGGDAGDGVWCPSTHHSTSNRKPEQAGKVLVSRLSWQHHCIPGGCIQPVLATRWWH